MNASIWDVLGIAATDDERAIKRAYAAKLRVTSPEVDPQGYMKLRDAYEAAKNYAAYEHYESEVTETSDSLTEPPEPASQAEQEVPIDEPRAPEAVAQLRTPASPQRQALEDLQALLAGNKPDEFLSKIQAIQDAQVFSTLDEQNDFIGEVAQLLQHSEVGEAEWRGRVAELLGARERDNIFAEGSEYWYAYSELLDNYSAMRNRTASAVAKNQEDIAAMPGYLHVYHVLTSPFDSERLMALTRSQAYYRLAESILHRARTDRSIVIPLENRHWWERTAMAGQHRPAAEPARVAAEPSSGSNIPGWMIWLVVMLIINGVRMCGDVGSSSTQYKPERFQSNPYPSPTVKPEDLAALSRLAGCDPQTRATLFQLRQKFVEMPKPGSLTLPQPYVVWDEKDPVVAALLAKCHRPP